MMPKDPIVRLEPSGQQRQQWNALLDQWEAGSPHAAWIRIEKSKRLLTLLAGGESLLTCRVGLGRQPVGHKLREGDGRTPEGEYTVCLIKAQGKYGRSLGLSYPNRRDAEAALHENRIDAATCQAICERLEAGQRPPWGTPLGGEIYIHEGGSATDWTQGCIALDEGDMDILFAHRERIAGVEILP